VLVSNLRLREFSSYREGGFGRYKNSRIEFGVKYLNFGARYLSFGAIYLNFVTKYLNFDAIHSNLTPRLKIESFRRVCGGGGWVPQDLLEIGVGKKYSAHPLVHFINTEEGVGAKPAKPGVFLVQSGRFFWWYKSSSV